METPNRVGGLSPWGPASPLSRESLALRSRRNAAGGVDLRWTRGQPRCSPLLFGIPRSVLPPAIPACPVWPLGFTGDISVTAVILGTCTQAASVWVSGRPLQVDTLCASLGLGRRTGWTPALPHPGPRTTCKALVGQVGVTQQICLCTRGGSVTGLPVPHPARGSVPTRNPGDSGEDLGPGHQPLPAAASPHPTQPLCTPALGTVYA